MGCDIHLCLERNRTIDGEKSWVNIDHWKVNPYFAKYPEEERKMQRVSVYDGRNYGLFSILAGVRNNANNIPLSEPKGFPTDADVITREEYDDWGCDAHSASYLTLMELMDGLVKYPNVKRSGLLNEKQRADLDNGILPDSWCQGTNQSGFEFREWEDESSLKWLIDAVNERVCEEFYIYDFYNKDKKESKILKEANDVRIVFWFDN